MNRSIGILAMATMILSSATMAQEKTIPLPAPQTDGGKPLMQILKARHSSREFSTKPLPLQVLSNLLWAANGINRTEDGKRTAPSARNWQDIDVYAALPQGMYLYNAKAHRLELVVAGDLRGATGQQDFVKEVPVNLVYVSNLARMTDATPDTREKYAAVDAGFVAENVYLFCASEGLAAVVRGSVDGKSLAAAMHLHEDQKVILAHSIGYPR